MKNEKMTHLIDSITGDCSDLFSKDVIQNARQLNGALGGNYFSEVQEPMYFTGKLDAKIVFVMLNPGNSADPEFSFAKNIKPGFTDFDSYLSDYMMRHHEFGRLRYGPGARIDNFDLKQASFLYDFPAPSLKLPDYFSDLKGDSEIRRKAARNVMMNKLQLEFIPYCSSKFIGLMGNHNQANKNISAFLPYISRMLESISAFKRDYVLWGAKQFYHLFSAYDKLFPGTVHFHEFQQYTIKGLKNRVSCRAVEITYEGKTIKGMMVYSFPRRDLPNAHLKMRAYGKKCCAYYESIFEA